MIFHHQHEIGKQNICQNHLVKEYRFGKLSQPDMARARLVQGRLSGHLEDPASVMILLHLLFTFQFGDYQPRQLSVS